MSVICGNCGNIIFVSNNTNWTTNKDNPELMCDICEENENQIHIKDIITTTEYVYR